jgi:small redox-active disulfide protein 2
MNIQILGTGCAKCKTLEKATRDAVAQAGIDATITKVEDIAVILSCGVITPAMVADGKVLVKSRVPGVEEIKALLRGFGNEKRN